MPYRLPPEEPPLLADEGVLLEVGSSCEACEALGVVTLGAETLDSALAETSVLELSTLACELEDSEPSLEDEDSATALRLLGP